MALSTPMMSCLVYIYWHSPDENLGYPSMNHEYLQTHTHTHTIYTVHTIESSEQENEHLCSHQQWRWGEVYKKHNMIPIFFCSNSQWIGLVGKFNRKPWFLHWRSSAFPVIFVPIQISKFYDFPYDISIFSKQFAIETVPNSHVSATKNSSPFWRSLHEVFQHVHGSGHHLSHWNDSLFVQTHQTGMIQWQNHWEMMIYIYYII